MTSIGPEAKIAFWRLSFAVAALTASSALYYYIDEMSFAHRELDGFIPALLLLRLAFAILVIGLLLAAVYPLRVLIFSGIEMLKEKRQGASVEAVLGSGSSGSPAAPAAGKKDDDFTHLFEGLASRMLYLCAVPAVWFLLKPAIDRALLPFGGVSWISTVFIFIIAGFAGYLAIWFLLELWLLVSRINKRRAALKPAPVQPVQTHPTTLSTIFCMHCGTPNLAGSRFCESCGEGME